MFNKREHKAIPEVGTVWRGTVSHEDLVSFLKNMNNEKVKSVELKIYNGITVMKSKNDKVDIVKSEIWVNNLGIMPGPFRPNIKMEEKEVNIEFYYSPNNTTTNAYIKIELN